RHTSLSRDWSSDVCSSDLSGYKMHDVYTPFPVHGLDHAMGMKETDLHIAGFIYGIAGTATALGFMGWIFAGDWPINFGGKPHFRLAERRVGIDSVARGSAG